MSNGRDGTPPWNRLRAEFGEAMVAGLEEIWEQRNPRFQATLLPRPETRAVELLDRLVADGYLAPEVHRSCPVCQEPVRQEPVPRICPDLECQADFARHDGVVEEVWYVRDIAADRGVDWMVVIHGMLSRGEWQEELGWFLSTTWGKSLPVSIYKYGKIFTGVLIALRRRQLQERFRARFAALSEQARKSGYSGKPDVVAHSFGTWLLGQMLRDECDRKKEDRLQLGRVILAGCVIRPDYDWRLVIEEKKVVEQVLCHCGSKDGVVPWAHYAIRHSGPSGRRGFDSDLVVNVMAEGYGHSDLFAVDQKVEHCAQCRKPDDVAGHHLAHSYHCCWEPFLTLPAEELAGLPNRFEPPESWRESPAPLRGTLLPYFALPALAALAGLAAAGLGWVAGRAVEALAWVAGVGLAGALALTSPAIWRWLRRR